MYSLLVLGLPLLAPALAHSIPRAPAPRHQHQAELDARALRDAATAMAIAGKRSYPKGHFGFPPSAGDLESSPGYASGQKLVRRVKSRRACKAQAPNALPSSSAASSPSVAAALVVKPSPASSPASTITSASAVSSPASTSAAAPVSTSSPTDSGLMGQLFPLGRGIADWTTAVGDADSLSFSAALNPLQAGHLPGTSSAPDGANAHVADFPAGTFGLPSGQGFSFYSQGGHAGVSVTGAKEVVFSYSVYFPAGFQFNKGGKLPGLYGGTSYDTAHSCSGGRADGRSSCFSARLMWRTNGAGEIYNYLPPGQASGYCDTAPFSTCNPNYGDSIARGAFTFPTGQWTTLALRLKLNDANVQNGEEELFVNGKSAIKLDNLLISADPQTRIWGIMAQTFFGGSDQSWASPVDQHAYFKDWSLAVLS